MSKSIFLLSLFFLYDSERTLDQQLIVACYNVDVDAVVQCLRSGASVNSRYGHNALSENPFRNAWTFDFPPIDGDDWTPLLALANSHELPAPPDPESVRNDPGLARDLRKKIPTSIIDKRRADEIIILQILLSHRCNLEDAAGATAIYYSARANRLEFAKKLLKAGANPNVRYAVDTNGISDLTPLHIAFRFPEMRKLLLEHGANANAKDTLGRKPGE